jgi:hypothetical protein
MTAFLAGPLSEARRMAGAAKAAESVALDWRKERRFMGGGEETERAEREGTRSRWRED